MYSYGGFGPSGNRTSYAWPNLAPANAGPQVICLTKAQIEFKNHMRLLWEQHVAWTRMAITSLVFGLPDTVVVLARLLQNAPDMGNALKPFYGQNIADTYGALIKEHLVIAADLVKAAKAGDTAAADAAEKKWYTNGDQIVEFLARINPYFPKEAFRQMFYSHLALVKAEAVSMLNKDYKMSVQLYDRIEREALMMADMIRNSILIQFPQRV
ncbi:acetylglutamate kinase [Paenibacillus sp. IHBB 3054]|uniref:acetylglutamate kinase n=1 Tax=Paenibacillus sp. IHBB 3054 TaxID=3425689 RepID=UPI003F66476F